MQASVKDMPMPMSDSPEAADQIDLSVLTDEELLGEVKKRGLQLEEEEGEVEMEDDMAESLPPMPV
jgi:hypothetical protein